MTRRVLSFQVVQLFLLLPLATSSLAAEPKLQLKSGDRICYIGNTLADRMQHHGWLETYIQSIHPELKLSFRNLGFAGDEINSRPRSANFGSSDEWLTKTQADVVLCFFGYGESLRGEAGVAQFEKNLAGMIDGMRGQKYNGESAPRLVVFSPIAHENLNSPHLPDGKENNKNLELFTQAMSDVCKAKDVLFVDLFSPTKKLYEGDKKPLTMNGIHLLEHGNRKLAKVIVGELFQGTPDSARSESELQRLREVILDRNLHWFSRYRVVDGYNVYGGRSTLAWFGQSNFDVMQREMEVFDVMAANRDKRVVAVAQGRDINVDDANIPPLLKVKTNKPGKLEDGAYSYLGGEEAISKMTLAKGMKANLFASEEMFPELINPVQMAVDTDSRLFASVWPSYPHWNPTEPRADRIVCLPDENGDGVADKCVVFADKLNSITGFEFWGGGMLVAAPPEIWFLKDTDGDDQADVKIRMLQGVSSADSHHSANAMVIGPDGGFYWSRGIFNVTNAETPTKIFRSSRSGVYRFDPRTFELSFEFPIGPNPHGDVFDQWGYQFANDGTSGTGSYVNIGKGVGNKQWFRKRVRPVAATGILSSSHFPEENNGNFLICNCIGVLGVLQHEVKYNGADISAVEIEPVLLSADPNFRPTDVEIGGDGALYVSDWANALIGHMQHNIRDPNRDHAHGRIYRITYEGRPLLTPVKMKGKPIETVLKSFFTKENSTRYRARLELSGRATKEVVSVVSEFVSDLNAGDQEHAQAMLESLWVFEEHRVLNIELLKRIYKGAKEQRARAAAIRTLGHWGERIDDWRPTLLAAARDDSALVRAEAVKAAVSFQGLEAAEIIFQVAGLPTDPELDTVINYARGQINVDKVVQDAVKSGKTLSVAAQRYVLRNASIADLLKLKRTEAVYRAILDRDNVSVKNLAEAVDGLAKLSKTNRLELLLELIADHDAKGKEGSLSGMGQLLASQSPEELRGVQEELKAFASKSKTSAAKQLGYAAWITADGNAKHAFAAAERDKASLRLALESIAVVPDDKIRSAAFEQVRPLINKLPPHMKSEQSGSSLAMSGVRVDYFEPNPPNVALETLAKIKPQASGVVPEIKMNVPQLKRRDAFALRFMGAIRIDRVGEYTFFTNSDDGSRLYIGSKLVVNNDGLHGMREVGGSIQLSPGNHPFAVTYFDNGGGDGLVVSYSGPGMRKQKLPASKLSVLGAETLHDVAIRTLSSIPGHEAEKFQDLAALVKSGKHRRSAVRAILDIPIKQWPVEGIRPVAEKLAAHVSDIPAAYRTGKTALEAMELTDKLASLLPPEEARQFQARLADLKVNVIRIGTVPHRMIYDKERIAVEAGKPVEFVFTNTDNMPHNFSIVQPGSLEEVGLLGEATARDPDAMARHYIPKSDRILLGSRLLQPKETQAISYVAPQEPGIYPYVCTYPGHWRRMYGAMYVVADLKKYLADPAKYLASNPLPLRDELLKYNARNTEWTFTELASAVKPIHEGAGHAMRNFDVGKSVFKVASCVACHRLNNEGLQFGPDLTKLDEKKRTAEHILRSLLEPGKDIDEKYRTHSFEMDSGKVVTGLILEETPDVVKVIVDPIAKPEPTILKKSEIEDRRKLPTSTMPKGLANRLSREEILDLITYVFARGDKKHKLFKEHEHN